MCLVNSGAQTGEFQGWRSLVGCRLWGCTELDMTAATSSRCWSWNSSTLATSCEELTHWIRLWCWEALVAGREGDDRGWDGWMASRTRWMWVWVNSESWWWTGRPGVLRFMGSQRVEHDLATELNWTEWNFIMDPLVRGEDHRCMLWWRGSNLKSENSRSLVIITYFFGFNKIF